MVNFNIKDKFKNGELDLSSCGLKDIPKEITTLKNITSLNLSNNKIASVGKIIGTLTHLNRLDLSRNHIKGLPENIGNLTNLKQLNLSSNQLATLPATVSKLKNLKSLDMKNNNLSPKFSDIVGPCQNESQCQQAAKNVIKAFSSQSDSEKKKKSAEQESKKKKTDKKAQNGGLTQPKQKDRKQKKPKTGFVSGLLRLLWTFVWYLFLAFFVACISFYAVSFYDQPRFNGFVSRVYPHYHAALSAVFTKEQTAKVEAAVVQANVAVNNTIVVCYQAAATSSRNVYKYLTTDETLHAWIVHAKASVSDLFGGNKKQKS